MLLEVVLLEIVDSNGQSVFAWPSAFVLALYLTSSVNLVLNKSVIELGAGNALPSIVSGKLGCRQITITDRLDTEMQNLIHSTIVTNNLQDIATAVPLVWGSGDSTIYQSTFDVILGADLFYSTEDFDSVLLTVHRIFIKNPSAIFLTTYQERRYYCHI